MRQYKRIRGLVCAVLSFFMTGMFAGLFLCMQLQSGLQSQRYFRESLRESSYMDGAWKELKEQVGARMKEKALPFEASDFLSENQAYLHLTNYVNAVFSGQDDPSSADEIGKTITNSIMEYLKEQGADLTSPVLQAVQDVGKESQRTAARYLEPDFVKQFYDYFTQGREITIAACLVCGSGITGIVILMLFLFRHKYKITGYLTCSILGAVFCSEAAALAVRFSGIKQKMITGPDYYQDFLNRFLTAAAWHQNMVTAVGLLLGIGCLDRKSVV